MAFLTCNSLFVLIETSWNVKLPSSRSQTDSNSVLIETSWNVKIYIWNGNKKLSMGINRNIVECKVLCLSFQTDPHSVLIETSWNVKDYESRCESVKEYSINRNIVECKGESS